MSIYNQPWRLVQNRVRGKGGREIDKFRGIYPPTDDNSGSEAWIGSVTRTGAQSNTENTAGCSEVFLPDGRRLFLFEAIALNPEAVLGQKHMNMHGQNLGMLIKYLDAQEQYGLQAHPTRPFAKEMWDSDFGKEESWYVFGLRDDAAEPPYIILGFKEGVTRETFEEEYRRGDIKRLEAMCHKIPVQIGDTFFVGGGLIHALGEGCLVVEVQEPCDITVVPRHYKHMQPWFDRRRAAGRPVDDEPTYDKKVLGSFIYDGCSYEENLRRWRIPNKTVREGPWGREYYLIGPEQTGYFSFTRADVKGGAPIRDTGFPQVAIVMEGGGFIKYDGGEFPINKADEIFLPYNIQNAALEGDVSVIFCHPEGAK